MKEYLSRGTYIFPPAESLRLTVDLVTYTVREVPKWNPINVCSYHLQEAGATPVQEVAYALATAIAVLDAVRESGQVAEEDMPQVVGRISFFVNAGLRSWRRCARCGRSHGCGMRICAERYGVERPEASPFPLWGAGQLARSHRAAAGERPPPDRAGDAGRDAVQKKQGRGLSSCRRGTRRSVCRGRGISSGRLRIQQILAFETDLLEYDDLFDGSKVVEAKVSALDEAASAELAEVLEMGGAFEAIDELKSRLVASQAERLHRIETGEEKVVGVNCFTETGPSPLHRSDDPAASILTVDPAVESELRDDVARWRRSRDSAAVSEALDALRRAAGSRENLMAATVALAHAGGTTGEWAGALREIFGEFRAPTGVSGGIGHRGDELAGAAERVSAITLSSGAPPRLLIGKPGLDGHSNGAERIAVAARDAGFEVVYAGIRSTTAELAAAALDEDVDVIGLSILSGSHLELVAEVLEQLREKGVDAPVVVGGIIPESDQQKLLEAGVAAIYTPKDYSMGVILADIAGLVAKHRDN